MNFCKGILHKTEHLLGSNLKLTLLLMPLLDVLGSLAQIGTTKDMKCIPWSLGPPIFFSFIVLVLVLCVCVCVGFKAPVMATTADRVPQRGFTPFSLIVVVHRGGPTSHGRFPFPIRTGTGCFHPVLLSSSIS